MWQGEIKVADRIKVANQLTIKRGDYLVFSGWAQCNHKCSYKCKVGAVEGEEMTVEGEVREVQFLV